MTFTFRASRTAPAGLLIAMALAGTVHAQAWITFTDQTATRLPTAASFTTDPDEKDFTLVDIDHDGDLDLFDFQKNGIYSTVSARSHRFLQNVGGSFIEATAAFVPDFLTNPSIGRLGCVADFDGDGWEDIVVVNTNNVGCTTGNQLHFYKNLGLNGSGVWLGLVFQSAGRFPQYNSPCARFCAGDFGDVDGDGDMDLYLGDYNNSLEDRLLINDGFGVFTDQTTTRIPGGTSSTFTVEVMIRDFNNDGWMDIGLSDGTVGLVKVRINAGAANPGTFLITVQPPNSATYTLAAGDLNNDGWLDLYQGRDGQDAYNLNLSTVPGQTPTFGSTTLNNSPGTSGFAGNAIIVDMDNDGWNDLVMGDVDVDVPSCSRHATLLRNIGATAAPGTPILMDPYAAASGCSPGSGGCQNFHTNGTHDIAVLDLNGDGAMDMIYGLCVGYRCFIQNLPPFQLTLSEPAPGAMSILCQFAPPFVPVYNLVSLVQLPAAGSGPFFGLDASALTFFNLLYPYEPCVGVTNAVGAYSFSLPAGTFNQAIPWTWQMRSVYVQGGSLGFSNVQTKTF